MSRSATSSDNLDSYKKQAMKEFKQTNSLLQDKRREASEKYVEPAMNFARQRTEERPALVAFLAAFIALSIIPVVSFVAFSVGTLLIVGGGAAVFALFWIVVLIGSAVGLLLGTLAFTAFLAGSAVFWTALGYLTLRLVLNIGGSASLTGGIQKTVDEARTLLIADRSQSSSAGERKEQAKGKKDNLLDQASDKVQEATDKTKELGEKAGAKAQEVTDEASSKAQEVGDQAGAKAQEASEKTKELGNKAGDKAQEAGNKAGNKAQEASEKTKEAGNKASNKAQEASDKTKEAGNKAGNKAQEVAEDVKVEGN